MLALGLDLAWSPRNPSGIAVAELEDGRWHLQEARADIVANQEVLAAVERIVGRKAAILAIDAPLVVPHRSRGRDGDRLITKVFGPHDAGVYPATKRTIGRYGGQRIWELRDALVARGFVHECWIPRGRRGRFFFETYPHAAAVALFRLPKVLKYKTREGRSLRERIEAFREYERLLVGLRNSEPPLDGVEAHLDKGLAASRGHALKDYEDRLDAILCAYIAAYYWTWGTTRCAIFGSLEGGYIVTPFNAELAARVPPASRVVTYDGLAPMRARRGTAPP